MKTLVDSINFVVVDRNTSAPFAALFNGQEIVTVANTYANNRFFFDPNFAADPNLDYTQWANLRKTRYLDFYINLSIYAGSP